MNSYIKTVIADDDSIIIKGMKKFIDWNEYGYDIIGIADNGRDLIDLCNKTEVNVVLSDIEMPKINGLDAIKSIINHNNSTKIILISGYEKFEYAKKAIEYGVFYYLLKPINPVELIGVLKKLKNEFNINSDNKCNEVQSNYRDINSIINDVKCLIDKNEDEDISLEFIEKKYYISKAYFSKKFKELTGDNFIKYRKEKKMIYAKYLVENTNYKFYEIAEKLNYDDERYFSRVFKKYYGRTPREFRGKI